MFKSRLVTTAVVAATLTACTGDEARTPTSDSSPSTQTPADSSARPRRSASGVGASAALRCEDYIGTEPPDSSYEIVLGVVALPASPGHRALQAGGRTGDGGSGRLFAKTGLLVRAGSNFELTVPAPVHDTMAVGWGSPARPTHRLRVAGCQPRAGEHAQWLAYAGGYLVNTVMCAPLLVTAGRRKEQVHIGIGAPCAAQDPPARSAP